MLVWFTGEWELKSKVNKRFCKYHSNLNNKTVNEQITLYDDRWLK